MILALALTVFTAGPAYAAGGAQPYVKLVSADQHFHPKGKPPLAHALKVIKKARETMSFADKKDFEEAESGFIAPLDSMVIKADAGHVVWDINRYEFLSEGHDFDSIHPSLQRVSTLNQKTGFFEVMPPFLCPSNTFRVSDGTAAVAWPHR